MQKADESGFDDGGPSQKEIDKGIKLRLKN